MGALKQLLDFLDEDNGTPDEVFWDRFCRVLWILIQAFWIGALVFIDLLMLDVAWTKAMLVSWLVMACFVTRIGAWTIRKLVVVLTIYAVAYVLGAAPALQTVGAFLTRLLS